MSKPTLDLAAFLRKELAEAQLRNPAFSIRALARKAGVGFGTLSMVLTGKRSVSQKTTLKILDRLGVAPETRTVIAMEAKPFKRKTPTAPLQFNQLTADQFYILSEWHYLAILSLVRTKNFDSDPKLIAKRLGIGVQLAKQSIDRLERTGLLQRENGRLVRTKAALKTTDDVHNPALRRSHYQTLDRARIALDEVPIEMRDFTWLTFRFNPERMPEFKKRVRKFVDEVNQEFTFDEESTEVYCFATHFFPLTKTEKKRKK